MRVIISLYSFSVFLVRHFQRLSLFFKMSTHAGLLDAKKKAIDLELYFSLASDVIAKAD